MAPPPKVQHRRWLVIWNWLGKVFSLYQHDLSYVRCLSNGLGSLWRLLPSPKTGHWYKGYGALLAIPNYELQTIDWVEFIILSALYWLYLRHGRPFMRTTINSKGIHTSESQAHSSSCHCFNVCLVLPKMLMVLHKFQDVSTTLDNFWQDPQFWMLYNDLP